MALKAASASEALGQPRQVKVLVRMPEGDIEGHRGFGVALRKTDRAIIVLAATHGEPAFEWGRLYLCENRRRGHHPYVVEPVDRVPNVAEWMLLEAALQTKAGWVEDD
jgi:hypothetical protein